MFTCVSAPEENKYRGISDYNLTKLWRFSQKLFVQINPLSYRNKLYYTSTSHQLSSYWGDSQLVYALGVGLTFPWSWAEEGYDGRMQTSHSRRRPATGWPFFLQICSQATETGFTKAGPLGLKILQLNGKTAAIQDLILYGKADLACAWEFSHLGWWWFMNDDEGPDHSLEEENNPDCSNNHP